MLPRNLFGDIDRVPTYSKNQKNRCTICNKKIGILGFSCRCNGNFCTLHRLPEQHNCCSLEEIKKESLEILSKNNYKVTADKLISI